MLGYVIIVLIALWVLLVSWIKYSRWRLKGLAENPTAEPEFQSAPARPVPAVQPIDLDPINVMVRGTERTAYYQEPEQPGPLPLLLCFHGGMGNSEQFAETSDLAARAQAWGFLAVFPDAEEGWVDGRPERGSGTEDLDFVVALVQRLEGDKLIDPARIFGIGLSNGGMFVQHLATKRPGLMAGGASVLASLPTAVVQSTSEGPPMPFVLACDTTDGVMPFSGGEIASTPGLGVGGHVIPVQAARSIWVERNDAGTAGPPKRVVGPGGCSANVFDHPAEPDGAPVRFVEIYGMGHRWPRWTGTRGEPEVNVADIVLEFFASQPVQDFAARSYKENQSIAQMGWGSV